MSAHIVSSSLLPAIVESIASFPIAGTATFKIKATEPTHTPVIRGFLWDLATGKSRLIQPKSVSGFIEFLGGG